MNNNDLKTSYKIRLDKIEAEISKILPRKCDANWFSMTGGDDLSHLKATEATHLVAPGYHLLSLGGKRWRPMLMLLACELAGGKEKALPLTPIVELPHNGSLIIDDIEDKSDFRRGKPAAHLTYGEDLAINAGNLLYYLPTTLIEKSLLPCEKKAALYEIYCRCMRRLHLGQGLDIQWHNNPTHIPDIKSYKTMCRLKTGALARMAAEMGHLIATGTPENQIALAQIAEDIGLAFQITDDIINLKTGNPGKKRGDDIVERKRSLPVVLYAQKNDTTQLLDYMKKANQLGIRKGNGAVESAIHLILNSDAIEKAENYASSLLEKASTELKERFIPCEALNLILAMLTSFKTA